VSSGESSVAARYRDGFSECAQEVDRFLASVSGLGHDTRYRLMNHLASCIKQQPASASTAPAPRRTLPPAPPAFNAPALNPGIYAGVQLPSVRADSTSESTVHDASMPAVDGRRRSVSVAAAPYDSAALFRGFVVPPSLTGRMSASALFPLADQQPTAATPGGVQSSFRPIQSPLTAASPTDSDQLNDDDDDDDDVDDVKMTRCRDDVDASTQRPVASSSCVGRPLAERNDNTDNIARGVLGSQSCDAAGTDLAAAAAAAAAGFDQSMMMYMLQHDVKGEHVWRPW